MEKKEKNKEEISILASYGLDNEMLKICESILMKNELDNVEKEVCQYIQNICYLHKDSLEATSLIAKSELKKRIYNELRRMLGWFDMI